MCAHCTPQRALGGDAYRVGRHMQTGNAELLKMAHPGFVIGKLALLMRGQLLDERSGQGMITHVVQGRVVDHVVGVAGTQQVQEVQATLATRRAEPCEFVVADLRADAVGATMARTGVVHRYPVGRFQTSTQHLPGLHQEIVLPVDEQAHDLPL